MATLCTVIFLNVRAFGLALRGVEKSKTPAYFGWKCRVFNTIQSAIQTRGRWPYRSAGSRAMNCDQITLECILMPWMTFCVTFKKFKKSLFHKMIMLEAGIELLTYCTIV